MASAPAYQQYATSVLMPSMDQDALAEILCMGGAGDTGNPAARSC